MISVENQIDSPRGGCFLRDMCKVGYARFVQRPLLALVRLRWDGNCPSPFFLKYSENIVKVAAVKHGLNQDAVRKHLEFLVESGAVYIESTANEEESYFIYDLEKFTDGDSKNCGYPVNGCSSSSDSLSLRFGDTRHDNSSPIKPDNGAQMSEFF